jgi:transcriptional regulator with PAS, ATPase and Fis domain
VNSLSAGGFWFLWEEDLRALRPFMEALAPRIGEVISHWHQLYTIYFKEPRSLSQSEFSTAYESHLIKTTAALIESQRDLWADQTHKLGEFLAERGVPFVEVIPSLHLYWESVIDVVSPYIEPTISMREAFSKLSHIRMILVADAYFKYWTAHHGARVVSLEQEAAESISTRRRKSFHGLIGASQSMRELYVRIEAASRTRGTILIYGESGTGKELIARAIHECAGEVLAPFVAVNCAALPKELIESELFGYKRGAFSGAIHDHLGLLPAANGGTLFLDEITEMAPETQSKLLRVLQERTIRPVGSTSENALDVRFLATTNRDPAEAVRSGRLREDLYYRLQTLVLHVPPLRDRREDIPLLVQHFMIVFNSRAGERKKLGVEESALEALKKHSWAGNVRELSNTIERAFTFGTSDWISLSDLELTENTDGVTPHQDAKAIRPSLAMVRRVEDLERDFVLRALEKTGGNKSRAASILGITRKTLYGKMETFGLRQYGRRGFRNRPL